MFEILLTCKTKELLYKTEQLFETLKDENGKPVKKVVDCVRVRLEMER